MAYLATGASVWAITQVGRRADGFSPGTAGSIAGNVLGYDPDRLGVAPVVPKAFIRALGPEDAPIADMELLVTASVLFAPTLDAAAGLGLLGAAATPLAPSADVAAALALLAAQGTTQAPTATATAGMPLLAGGPGTQAPTPGASTDIPLAVTQLILFDPEALTAIIVQIPLLEALVYMPPPIVDLQQPPPITRGRSSGRREPAPVAREVRMPVLGIRAEILPWELGIWTVELAASLESRLELFDPTIATTWPVATLRRVADALLDDQEDPLGLGI